MAKAHTPRNSLLPGGISRLSRSAVYKKRATYKKKVKKIKAKKAVEELTKTKTVGGEKNGGTRVVQVQKESRFYPVDDVKKPLKNRKTPKITKLRLSLVPGTVLILLAGRHKGKRVVFLKQLESGLLLVTGPYKVNGVPLRRVPQSYVIATQTKVDISGVQVPERVNDSTLRRVKKKKQSQDSMFEEADEGYKPSEERKADQEIVDEAILSKISAVPHLRKYMQQLFTLRKGQYPHSMVF